jgi:hypothetical protein
VITPDESPLLIGEGDGRGQSPLPVLPLSTIFPSSHFFPEDPYKTMMVCMKRSPSFILQEVTSLTIRRMMRYGHDLFTKPVPGTRDTGPRLLPS